MDFLVSTSTESSFFHLFAVILVDYYDLPFNDVLDWRKFCVILNEGDVYRLKHILKAKVGKELRMLQSNLLQVK